MYQRRTMKKIVLLALVSIVQSLFTQAQIGGQNTYTFLNMPSSARSAAMGGDFITIRDGDLNLVLDNPAVLDSTMHQHLTLSYVNWLSDVNLGYGAYARHFEGIGTFSVGMQYINYGTFTEANSTGIRTGEFTAGEYAMDLTYSKNLHPQWNVGGSFKIIYSNLANLNSMGLALDLGAHYQSKSDNLQAGLVLNNMGFQLFSYTPGVREPLPFEMQLGISQKLAKAPLRFTFLASNLQQYDVLYDEPRDGLPALSPAGSYNTNPKDDSFITADKLFRHVVIGAEILASENFHLRLSYNYRRRQEMGVAARGGLTGFSFGVGFKIRKIHFAWGLSQYHLAGSSNHFTITTNLNSFSRN